MNKIIFFIAIVFLVGIVSANSITQQVTVNIISISDQVNINLNNPESNFLSERRSSFNVSLNQIVEELSYINYADSFPRERVLCRNCDSYGFERTRLISLREGENNISFFARNDSEIVGLKNLILFVDSRDPRITKFNPKKGFSSGFFEVEFVESNFFGLTLFYGNEETGFTQYFVNRGSNCSLDGDKHSCSFYVDLSSYSGEEIDYFFYLSDILGNSDETRSRTLSVDTVLPVLNNPGSFWEQGENFYSRYIFFEFNITEDNFDKITYTDLDSDNPRERTLCSRLREDICTSRRLFRQENINLSINIYDEAGNFIEEFVSNK